MEVEKEKEEEEMSANVKPIGTENTLPQTTKSGAPAAPLIGGGSITAIVPKDIDQAFRLAQIIAAANMAPKGYERDASKIMVAMLHGMELGLTPMASLQSIAVVNGMPTVWGDGALALVRASGLLEDINEYFEGEDLAVCTLTRKGQATKITRTFGVANAQKAGLLNKESPWKTYPARMMQMRARSWALRDGFADVLRGLHVREEVEDMQVLEAGKDGVYTPVEARPTRAQLSPQTEPLPTEVKDETPTANEAPESDPWLISPEAFPSLYAFAAEWDRQLREVCSTPEDVDLLVNANTTRLDAWASDRSSKAAVGAMQADADTRRSHLTTEAA